MKRCILIILSSSISTVECLRLSSQWNASPDIQLDPSNVQHSFLSLQERMQMDNLSIEGRDSSTSLYNFEWSKDTPRMDMPDGSQLLPISFTEAAPELFSKGMAMCGDSTMRNLFALMCGFKMGITTERELNKYEYILKDRKDSFEYERCASGDLTFVAFYHAYEWKRCHKFMQNTKAKYKFVGAPGAHSLWSPGGREQHGTVCTHKSQDDFHQSLTHMIGNFSAMPIVFGNTVSMCDKRLGGEGDLVKLYWMQRQAAAQGIPAPNYLERTSGNKYTPEQAILQIEQQKDLGHLGHERDEYIDSMKRSNRIQPVPWLHCATSGDNDRGRDDYLFWDKGSQHFNSEVMKISTGHPKMLIADMHAATLARCDHTVDGRHYSARVMAIQASLLSTLWSFHEHS